MAKKNSFETQLQQLEEIVAQLESGDLELEQSIKSFEQGIKLIQFCQKALNEAELKVQVLSIEDQDSSDD